ncbi:FliI/YscN family ATPase [Treponema sp.]|jgi:flagellum-specific ATP synthase|uniref:FliI/YscN family ATPase n=1 Tax=Treponema sp. TaxID=166 RepID=UPI00257AB8ED|nr:FliI/YscN family ATPase [Treponema sp.]MBE6355286.1 FliI/YscN family ATPase [Treponema sp.]
MEKFFDKYTKIVQRTEPIKYTGTVTSVNSSFIESLGPSSVIGEICTIEVKSKNTEILAEVISLDGKTVKLMPFSTTEGIEVGAAVVGSGHLLEVPVGEGLIGRVVDCLGRPCDGKGDISCSDYYPAVASAPAFLTRKNLDSRVSTGVRAIDALLTVAKGQRLGIFAGSGVGKSTLMGMIARNTDADINVIALIGERGREVPEFIMNDLGEEGLKRSVVVAATGDMSQIAKIRAAYVATAIAEYFRDQGKNVMLMIDSITRFAQAQRDVGSSNGEPPQRRGYPASTFNMIQKLLERAGANDRGTITAFYTVLVEGGEMDEPVSDTVRGILDGHIILSRQLQERQHYPAIDVLPSISRLARKVNGKNTLKAVQRVKAWMATYAQQEEMIIAGVYQKGNSPEIDEAIEHHQAIEEFLCQEEYEESSMEQTLQKLSVLSGIEIPPEEYTSQPQFA